MSRSRGTANFSFVLTCFQCIGLAFFAVSKSNFSELHQKHRWIHFILIAIGLLISLICLLYNNVTEKNYDLGVFTRIHAIVGFVQLSVNFITSFAAVISSFMKSNVEEKIFKKIDEIDELIKKEFSLEVSSRKYKLSMNILLQVMFYLARYAFRYFVVLRSMSLMLFLGYAFMVLIMKIYFLKYFLFVQVLKFRLQILTDIIESLQNSQIKGTIRQIKTIKRIHLEILDVVAMINECCGLTLLFLFIDIFISMTNKVYALFLSVINVYRIEHLIGK